jgi:hypothetical protein
LACVVTRRHGMTTASRLGINHLRAPSSRVVMVVMPCLTVVTSRRMHVVHSVTTQGIDEN